MPAAEPIPALFDPSGPLAEFCRRYRVRRLELFGSAATGRGFDPDRSDADFVVTFEDMNNAEHTDSFFGLSEALETLAGRSIDLLTDVSIVNPYLRRRIDAERRLLFQAV
jgi:predicted nucleotidyltransferase